MKKTLLIALITLLTVFSVTAENLKIKIEGPEKSYNQMWIVNNTSKSDFDCKVYSLKQKDEKFIIQGTLGVFYLIRCTFFKYIIRISLLLLFLLLNISRLISIPFFCKRVSTLDNSEILD